MAPIRFLPGPLATSLALLLGARWALASAAPAAAVNTYQKYRIYRAFSGEGGNRTHDTAIFRPRRGAL